MSIEVCNGMPEQSRNVCVCLAPVRVFAHVRQQPTNETSILGQDGQDLRSQASTNSSITEVFMRRRRGASLHPVLHVRCGSAASV
eukprot:6464950-Amphidinium_carterae.2